MGEVNGKKVNIDVVILSGHANADVFRIYTNADDSAKNVRINADFINSLDEKSMAYLMLMGCNMGSSSRDAGKTTAGNENLATKVINGKHGIGKLIAADGSTTTYPSGHLAAGVPWGMSWSQYREYIRVHLVGGYPISDGYKLYTKDGNVKILGRMFNSLLDLIQAAG